MSSSANVQAPSGLLADIKHRSDGSHRMFGIHLRWQIGGNRPDHGTWPPPEDWNNGDAPYPHVYEVWINGEARQTVFLHWPAWDWSFGNSRMARTEVQLSVNELTAGLRRRPHSDSKS